MDMGLRPTTNNNTHHPSLTPKRYLKWVKVFSMKVLVKMSTVCSMDGQYCSEITLSCTKPRMQCMWISMWFVLCICTWSVYILIAHWLSTQMLVGESIMTPNSRIIPCNQTQCVATLTAALYSAFADESEIVFYFLLYQQMGPSENMKTKNTVDFLSVGSLAESEFENLTSWSEELAM